MRKKIALLVEYVMCEFNLHSDICPIYDVFLPWCSFFLPILNSLVIDHLSGFSVAARSLLFDGIYTKNIRTYETYYTIVCKVTWKCRRTYWYVLPFIFLNALEHRKHITSLFIHERFFKCWYNSSSSLIVDMFCPSGTPQYNAKYPKIPLKLNEFESVIL